MKMIGIVTATRAEYGLLSPVIKELRKRESSSLKVELVVTGTHLLKEYGNTIEEIIGLGQRVDEIIDISVASADEVNISRNQADVLIKFTELFVRKRYKGVVILGDRYEMLAVAIAASNTRTPIFHLCGGDTTEGAMDEWIRHSITKMSYLHFVTNADSYRRVLQLGESRNRIFNYGSTSIDNIMQVGGMSRIDALKSLGISDCKYAIGTYHPATMLSKSVDNQIECFIEALKRWHDITFIITKANSDQGGAHINELLDEAEKGARNIKVFHSLGYVRYLTLMKDAEFVIGNSSSGIIETPSFRIPTINIGDRQRGRLQAESIINCEEDTDSISSAIEIAQSDKFKRLCSGVVSPYGDGHAAEKIATKIIEYMENDEIDLRKNFCILFERED